MNHQAPRRAPNVAYSTHPALPDALMFTCAPNAARITTTTCARMFREGNHTDAGLPGGRLAKCRSCPIGAAHAGEEIVYFPTLYGQDICPRCGKGTTRMIQNRVCVSCRNREYELDRGRNAKGTAPVNLRPLFRTSLTYTVNGHPHRFRAPLCTGIPEAMAQVMRTTTGRIAFAFQGDAAHIRQPRLL